MASQQQVKEYLAYWFQLGKKVVHSNSYKAILPQPVVQGEHYSQAFEDCWQVITSSNLDAWYLEGTEQTIAQLLTPAWEVSACARCLMPVPVRNVGIASLSCPCDDLTNWPNTQVPAPRSPVNNQMQLMHIRDRLIKTPQQ